MVQMHERVSRGYPRRARIGGHYVDWTTSGRYSMQSKLWVHAITLGACVIALVCTLTFFSSQPLLPQPVFIAVLALTVAMVIVSMSVWVLDRLATEMHEMEERLSESFSPRR